MEMDKKLIGALSNMAVLGTENERAIAKEILKRRFNIDELDSDSEVEAVVWLKYKTRYERTLIIQTYSALMNVSRIKTYRSGRASTIGLKLPADLAAKFRERVTTVLGAWHDEVESLFLGFILVNKLMPQNSKEEEDVCKEMDWRKATRHAESIRRLIFDHQLNE